jgi:hypothetical protein
MQTQDVREFVAFCEYLAGDENPHLHLISLMRQLSSSIAAGGSPDEHGGQTRKFDGIQRSARQFVKAYHRLHAHKDLPECIHTLMNAASNPQFVKKFSEEIRRMTDSLPKSVRIPSLPPPPAKGGNDDNETP